jgi:hypothetical protein
MSDIVTDASEHPSLEGALVGLSPSQRGKRSRRLKKVQTDHINHPSLTALTALTIYD